MKKIILLLTLSLGVTINAQSKEDLKDMKANLAAIAKAQGKAKRKVIPAEIHWEDQFKTCLAKAKKEKKPIFVLFTGTDWCVPCNKLEKNVLETQKFKNYADKYFILYKADFPRNKDLVSKQNKAWNQKLKKKFKQRSFPTIIVIDDNANAYGKREGIYTWDSYYDFFDEVVMNVKAKKFVK